MTTSIPFFVELCAGTAALSLRLHKDGARPPVSRMGAKTGYADAILRVLGLYPGQRAERYLWCEPDPGVRLLLHAYRDARLAKAAAAIIRGWKDEDPRALWERLRAEGPPKLPEGEVEAGEVARFVLSEGWGGLRGVTFNGPGCHPSHAGSRTPATMSDRIDALPHLAATIAPDARTIDPREVARFAQIVASNRLINTAWSDAEGRWINTGHGGATFGGPTFASPPERTAEGLDAAPADLPAVVAPDARGVDPREVARGLWLSKRTWQDGKSFKADIRVNPCADIARAGRAWMPDDPAPAVDALPHLADATITPDAREVDPREVARLLYMAPVAARPDCIDTWNADAKLGGDDLLGHGTVPDVAHKLIVQQGASVALADLGCPVSDLVADVDRLGGPREVVGPIVAAQAVQVARNHSSRTGPVERLTDKGADTPMDAATSAAHDQLSIAVLVNPASQGPVGIDRLDLPHVADHVLGSLGDDPPFFSHMDTSTATISYGGASVQLPPGTVCYMDPSYVGTTGYADNLSRPEVVALARRWAEAGATVAISEAEPIPELVAEGWFAVEITGERIGQKRTFSKQQREWLTINRAPAWTPPIQNCLFEHARK